MSHTEPRFLPVVSRLLEHLKQEQYSPAVITNYPVAVRRFLRDLERRGVRLESETTVHVNNYLDALRFRRRRGKFPHDFRRIHRAAIQMLLRLVHGSWPPQVEPTTGPERYAYKIVTAFDAWMTDRRGLSAESRRGRRAEAYRFMTWTHEQGKALTALDIADVDAYIDARIVSMRRSTTAEVVSIFRVVLRYLRDKGLITRDLASLTKGPPIYALEGIPSAINLEDVHRALEGVKQDHSLLGRRDYAIWMLLTTYGLRSGEIRSLCLTDIDWRHERLHIRHSKTGAHSDLPLLRGPADAILNYLRYGRPKSTCRAVFLRSQAPYHELTSSCSLHGIVGRGLPQWTSSRPANVVRMLSDMPGPLAYCAVEYR